MARREVEIALKGKDEGASSAVDRLAQRLKLMRKESAAAGENALGKAFGSGKGFSDAAMDAIGVGAQSIVVEGLGRAFSSVTDKAVELRNAMREGKTDAREFALEMAKSLPLIGPFVSGFLNVRELITGEKAAIAELNKEMEESVKWQKARLDLATKTRQEHEATINFVRGIENEMRLSGLMEPEKTRESIRQRTEKAIKAKTDEFAKMPRAGAELDAEIAAKNKEIREFGDRVFGFGSLNELEASRERMKRKSPNFNNPVVDAEIERLRAEAKRLEVERDNLVQKQKQAQKQREQDLLNSTFAIRRQAGRDRLKHEVGFLKEQAENFLKGFSDLVENGANSERLNTRQRERFQEQQEEQRNARKRALDALNPAAQRENRFQLDKEIEAQEKALEEQRAAMGAAGQSRASVTATLLSSRFTDRAGMERDRDAERAQKTREEQVATLKKMEEHLAELKKKRDGRAL